MWSVDSVCLEVIGKAKTYTKVKQKWCLLFEDLLELDFKGRKVQEQKYWIAKKLKDQTKTFTAFSKAVRQEKRILLITWEGWRFSWQAFIFSWDSCVPDTLTFGTVGQRWIAYLHLHCKTLCSMVKYQMEVRDLVINYFLNPYSLLCCEDVGSKIC